MNNRQSELPGSATQGARQMRASTRLNAVGIVTLALALFPAPGHAQDKPQPAATNEIRYCTNCATVEALKLVPAGGAAQRYEMVLRYGDGKVKTFKYDNDPGLRVGEKVKDNNGVVVRDVPAKPPG